MRQTVCDRCGTVIDVDNQERSITIVTYQYETVGGPKMLANQDLCPTCAGFLDDFMHGRAVSSTRPEAARRMRIN